MNETAVRIRLNLGRNTIVRLTSIGRVDEKDDHALIPCDYILETKGHSRLSTWQIRKKLARWLINTLWLGALDSPSGHSDPLVQRKSAAAQRWTAKHIRIIPDA